MHVLLMRGEFYATPTCTGFPVLWQYKSCKELNEKEGAGQQMVGAARDKWTISIHPLLVEVFSMPEQVIEIALLDVSYKWLSY